MNKQSLEANSKIKGTKITQHGKWLVVFSFEKTKKVPSSVLSPTCGNFETNSPNMGLSSW